MTRYPYVVTDRSCALVFDYQYVKHEEEQNGSNNTTEGFDIDLKDKK
jgi:hypothetical protein